MQELTKEQLIDTIINNLSGEEQVEFIKMLKATILDRLKARTGTLSDELKSTQVLSDKITAA